MSANASSLQGRRVDVERGEKIGRKSQIQLTQSGDDNANQFSLSGDEEAKGLLASAVPPLVSQSESPEKLVIWGSEQQCLEGELRDFELLERQEIHTFLRNRDEEEEEEEGGSVRDGNEEGPMSMSSSSTASSISVGTRRNDNDSNDVDDGTRSRGVSCQSSEELDEYVRKDGRSGRERRRGVLKESKSESNVFVSSLSAASLGGSLSGALNTSGEAFYVSLSNSEIRHHPNDATSAQTRRQAAPADANQNSPPRHPQEDHSYPQNQRQGPGEGSQHRTGLSSDGGLGQRRKAGFEERVAPPRRQQLVRPLCQTEMGRARSLPESGSQHTDTGPLSSLRPALDRNGSALKCPKSSLREPSDFSHLYNAVGVSQLRKPNQAPPLETQPPAAVPQSSSPSNSSPVRRPQTQLTYRRNCSSPNRIGAESRSSTPPHSPLRTPQGSPRRQPSMFLVSRTVSGVVRHAPTGPNPMVPPPAQGYGSSCLRVKTNISTSGIPKAPLNKQQGPPKENSPSPKLKPKGVRPKIITYIRKGPQTRPQAADGPYQVSSLPSRLSTYAHSHTPPSFRDTTKEPPRPGAATRGNPPTLSASNLLYDKYQQETPAGVSGRSIRVPGHTNTVPPAHTHANTVPPAHTHSHTAPPNVGRGAENFYGSEVGRSVAIRSVCGEDGLQRTAPQPGGGASLRGLRLGLGAVTRTTSASAKLRGTGQGQKSTLVFSQPVQAVSPATNQRAPEPSDEQAFHPPPSGPPAQLHAAPPAQLHAAPPAQLHGIPPAQLHGVPPAQLHAAPPAQLHAVPPAQLHGVPPAQLHGVPPAQLHAAPPAQLHGAPSRSLLPKSAASGLRPPGFSSSRVPAGRLAAFGFVRSSSASSGPPEENTQSATCRPAHRLGEDPPPHRVTSDPSDHQRAPCRRNSLQPPNTPALPRRYLPPQPRSSPTVGRKEFQRSEVTRSLPSSPKRLAVVPPKPQSPVQSSQRPAAAACRHGASLRQQQEEQESLEREKEEAQRKEREREEEEEKEKQERREEVFRLQGRCDLQEKLLESLRDELRKTSLGLEAFIITTQHYCQKNKTTEEIQRKTNLEMKKLKEEMASNSVRWERLHQEKAALEAAFEAELQELQVQQEAELAEVEESLRRSHSAESEHLRAEHRCHLEELRTQQQEQMEEMTVNHQAAVQELREMHNITMATLHEEHARTMRDLRKAHEQQKMLLEEDFDKLRLSLQDQVDTLTFQNQSLKDRARRFEEALRRSTDEQIVDALAPYQHIEEDLRSLKDVLEMKNLQIHQQDKKISDLERVAQKNVFLEEKVQVLQQQNEDLKARIDKNLSVSRHLSEENANLHEWAEKENTERKRLSRNNEELLWRLQTSPLMSPASSPLHRAFSPSPLPSSPSPLHRPFSTSPLPSSPSPLHSCDSPSHCSGCPQQAHGSSPSHGILATNQNLSPGPATPTHREASNQNYSPNHRASPNGCSSNACVR